MNSNLPPIMRPGPPIAPKPKNIRIQAGKVIRINQNENDSSSSSTRYPTPPLIPPPPIPGSLNLNQTTFKNPLLNDITSNTTNVPVFHAKFIKPTTDNNNNYNSDEMDYKIIRKSINDLPLPPSPETLTALENSNDDRIEDLNNIKLILMKPKRAEDNIYVNNNIPGHMHVKNNNPDNTTINVSTDSANVPSITVMTKNQPSTKTPPNHENTESKTYNIPIQHVPSSKSNNNLNNEILDNSINELLALKDSNIDVFKKNNSSNRTSTEDQVDMLNELLMKNLLGSQDPNFEGICGKCGESILGSIGVKAMDQLFHAKCFNCVICNISIKDKHFYVMDSKAYCEGCYLRSLERCSVCSNPITDRILRATGKPFHPECFCCTVCKNNLDGVPFTVDASGKIHCINCFHNKYAPRCHICRLPITPDIGQEETTRIVALDKSFHVSCYKCEDCGVLLSSSSGAGGCYPLDDHIYCKNCNIQRIRNLKGIATKEQCALPIVSARTTDL